MLTQNTFIVIHSFIHHAVGGGGGSARQRKEQQQQTEAATLTASTTLLELDIWNRKHRHAFSAAPENTADLGTPSAAQRARSAKSRAPPPLEPPPLEPCGGGCGQHSAMGEQAAAAPSSSKRRPQCTANTAKSKCPVWLDLSSLGTRQHAQLQGQEK